VASRIKSHPNIRGPEKIFGDIYAIRCRDYVDSTNSHILDAMITRLLSQGHYKILIDFTELNFITSDVPNTLISHIGKSRDNGGDILLLNPMENVMDIIEMLGLSEIFNIAPDEGTVMNYFRNLDMAPPSKDGKETAG
jgi:anti-anti-sigma factor